MSAYTWRQQAACRDEDPELFFPIGTAGPALIQVAQAKAVCRRCPVASTCLDLALDTAVADGVWGGMDEEDRKAEHIRRTKPGACLRCSTPIKRGRKYCTRYCTDTHRAELARETWREKYPLSRLT